MSNFDIVRDMIGARPPATSGYYTPATVTRVEGDTAWVHIDGGVDETPVKMTIAAHAGDKVQVRVGGGTAWLTGNGSRPPTDDALAELAKLTADGAVESIRIQQAIIERLVAEVVTTKFIQSPDYVAEDIPKQYPTTGLYPSESTYPSDGLLVLSGFAIDFTRGLILGAFYSRQLELLDRRVTALEQRSTLTSMSLASPMMQTTDTEESKDELQ
jgi:hypothetical protein